MPDSQITKTLTLTALGPCQMTEHLLTFQRSVRARSGTLLEVRWRSADQTDGCEAAVTYSLPS